MAHKEVFMRSTERERRRLDLLAEPGRDEFRQRGDGGLGIRPGCTDRDAAAGAGGQHHQPHDRGAADDDAVLLHFDRGIEAARDLHKLGGGAGVQPALVDDLQAARDARNGSLGPRHLAASTWLATLMYLRPAFCASARAFSMSSLARTLVSLISIGRLTPAITSTLPERMMEIARFEGVPPNMSVRMMTPWPVSARLTASMMSRRRFSMSSSAPIETVSKCSCGPTTCSTACRNSSAS